ncbi:MAG: hypothetical protein Q4C50_12500 [Eubacteriales bacterium]|nr:hypothetical protein [Eubacteriales bacterium]
MQRTEKAFDIAYQNEFNAFMRVSNMISDYAGIDAKTAREMVRTQREKLLSALS